MHIFRKSCERLHFGFNISSRNMSSKMKKGFAPIRFNRELEKDIDEHNAIKKQKNLSAKNNKIDHSSFSEKNLKEFSIEERLSKRLSRLGVCSRRQGERLIAEGIVYVDGKQVESNIAVGENNHISIKTKGRQYVPEKQSMQLWLYHKPPGLITTQNDPQGRLDYNSEGLMLVTNEGPLAHVLETHPFERSYKVRVYGKMFDEKKLSKIREGMTINGIQYGPYICEVIKRGSSNTWLHMKLRSGKNNEIRRVMEKLSLRVNRIIRVSYGNYLLSKVKSANDITQVELTGEIKHLLSNFYRNKAESQQLRLEELKSELRLRNEERKEKIGDDKLNMPDDMLIEDGFNFENEEMEKDDGLHLPIADYIQ